LVSLSAADRNCSYSIGTGQLFAPLGHYAVAHTVLTVDYDDKLFADKDVKLGTSLFNRQLLLALGQVTDPAEVR